MLKRREADPARYRQAMRQFASSVHVLTTDGAAGRRGVTVTAACSVSIAPPTLLVCLNRESEDNARFEENGVFALNMLATGQEALARGFAGEDGQEQDDRFALACWDRMDTGSPALLGAVAVFDCELADAQTMATHRILYGRVTDIRIDDNLRPLVHYRRSYHVL